MARIDVQRRAIERGSLIKAHHFEKDRRKITQPVGRPGLQIERGLVVDRSFGQIAPGRESLAERSMKLPLSQVIGCGGEGHRHQNPPSGRF